MSDHDQDIPSKSGGRDSARYRGAAQASGDGGGVDRDGEAAARPARGVLKTVLLAAGVLIGGVLILLVLFVFALQTNWGGTNFADFLIALASPFNEAEIEYDELNGNFITGIELTDLNLFRVDTVYVDTVRTNPLTIRRVPADSVRAPGAVAAFDTLVVDSLKLAAIDTFRIRYNLLSLLRRRINLRELHVANASFWAHQAADSSWDLMEPFGVDTSQAEPGQATFTFQIGDVDITDAELTATYYPADRDSVLQVRDLNLKAGDILFTDQVSARLDTLHGSYSPAGQDYWTDVRAGGGILENEVHITNLMLDSPYSLVTAAGSLRIPTGEDDDVDGIDFELVADPITFVDLQPFIPALNVDRSATLNVRIDGSSRLVNVDAAGTLSDGGSFNLDGAISPMADGPVQYRAEGRLENIDPSFFTGEGSASTLLQATFQADLEGTDLQNLDGTASAQLTNSRLGGLPLASGRFSAEFDGGSADVELLSAFNGSTISAEGTIRPFDNMPSYRLDGRATNFNLASVGQTNQQSDIDATFHVDGSGFDPRTAEIDGNVRFSQSAINSYLLNGGRIQFELLESEMTYGFRFLFPDGLLVANGSARFDDPLRFAVQRGRFENVDVAALLGQDRPSSLTGTFRLEGTGSDPQQMTAEALLDMEPSTYGEYALADGEISVNLQNGLLRAEALADLADAGRFDFAAVTRPFDDVPTVRITEGAFTNVDIGALLGNAEQSSDLNGTAALTMRGFEPATMNLGGRFTLADSRLNEQQITAMSADVDLSRGSLSFEAELEVPEGSANLAGTARPFLDEPAFDVTDGRFRNINLGAFTGNPGMESSLNGTLSVAGTGFDPETMNAEGRVNVTDSRLNQQQINSAVIAGRLEDGTIDVDLSLNVPEGDTRLSATINPFLEIPTYTVHEGTFAGINVAALTGNDNWQTNLAGNLSLSGQGFDPDSMSAEGTLEFLESTINDAVLSRGQVAGSLDDGAAQFDADLVFAGGSADIHGEGHLFREVPDYQFDGTLTNVNIGNIMGRDTLQARVSAAFDIEGSGTNPRTMELRGTVSSGDALYQGANVDNLHAQFALSDGIFQVDSLLIRSSALDASGSGVVAVYDTTTASDFRFTAVVKDLQPVRDFVEADQLQIEEGNLMGRIYGRPGTLRFDASGTVSSLIYENVRISEFDGTIAGELGPDRSLTVAEVQGDFSAISLPQLLIESADMSLTYTPGGISFDGSIIIEEGRIGQIAGRVETGPEQQRVVLETLTLSLDNRTWQLLQEASISYGEEYRVSNFLLYSGNQQLAIDGVIDPDGQQNLVMTIESFEINRFTDILGYDGMDGIVNGALMLTGPAASPEMTGNVNARLASSATSVGDLELALDYDSLRLDVDALLTNQDGSTLSAEGYLPLDLRIARMSEGGVEGEMVDRSVEFEVVADSFGIEWIRPFVDPASINEISGHLTADIDVAGTMDEPLLSGTARLLGGRIGIPELGLTYQGIEANFTLAENEVSLSDFVINSGDGSIRGAGTINLPQLTLGEFNIDLRARDFRAINSQEYGFVIDGDMILSGTTDLPVLTGDVDVVSGTIQLTNQASSAALEAVELSSEAILTVEQRFGIHITAQDTTTFSLYNALAMNLDVSIDRNTWIRSEVNPIMDIQFSGDVDLEKEHFEDVAIFGTIEVVPQRSQIVQFGKRFDIASGTLTFNGPAADPLIDVVAEYKVGTFGVGVSGEAVTITLSLEGRMSEQLDLTLGSDPQLEYADIVSYLATGRPAGTGTFLSGQTLLGTGGGLAFGQITAMMEGIAEAGLGLDVIALEYELGQPVITAGTSVSPRLFVAVSQPIDDPGTTTGGRGQIGNRPMFTVEYEVNNWLLARVLQYGQTLHLNLQWEYAY